MAVAKLKAGFIMFIMIGTLKICGIYMYIIYRNLDPKQPADRLTCKLGGTGGTSRGKPRPRVIVVELGDRAQACPGHRGHDR